MIGTVPAEQFPPGLLDALAREIDTLSDEIIAGIARDVPAYARPLEGEFGRGVRGGVDEALRRFLTVVRAGAGVRAGADGTRGSGEPEPDLAESREIYVALGRGEVRAGRSLDTLLGAYRVGARIAWRRFADAARGGGLDADGLVSLAEILFAYIDRISAASAQGYALEQFEAESERGRLRDRIGELLLSGSDPERLEATARAAAFRLPDTLAAVLIPASRDAPAHQRAPLLPPDVPRARARDDLWAFVPDPAGPGRRGWLERTLAGLGAVVGPTVGWREAPESAARASFAQAARLAGRMGRCGAAVGEGREVLFTDDHLGALVLAGDPRLVADLARRRLAPLDGLPAKVRHRLAETLLQWLTLRGQRGRIAAVLQVHPQTVRYRLTQLRTLFGTALDDPDARFELELVLRAGHT